MHRPVRFFFCCSLLIPAFPAPAAAGLKLGAVNEFEVWLTPQLRELAGHDRPSPVKTARVAVALPADFDPARVWPIMVICATSDPGYNSSRKLLGRYADTARAAGWILLAADPAEKISPAEDNHTLRFVLAVGALDGLEQQWPGAGKAPLALGGFSGGAKHAGCLAAQFALLGRRPAGVYQAGINQETLAASGRQFNILNDAFRRIPVFLQAGEDDPVATPEDHRRVQAELKQAGFKQVKLEYFPGGHTVDSRPFRRALEWFQAAAAPPASTK